MELSLVNNTGRVASLSNHRAQRMLRRLQDSPFIAIIVDEAGNRVVMYTSGVCIGKEQLRRIRELLDELEEAQEDGHQEQEEVEGPSPEDFS